MLLFYSESLQHQLSREAEQGLTASELLAEPGKEAVKSVGSQFS